MKKKLINSTVFPLEGTKKRFYHLATIQRSLREFMHFIDSWTGQAYIEEMTGAKLSFIDDDELFLELEQFLADKGVHHCQRVNLSDDIWRRHPLNKKSFVMPTCDILSMPMPANIIKK